MEERSFTTNGKIWLEIEGLKIMGPGRAELLERIHASGSIRQAALQMKMSYRQAWNMIKQINAYFKQPLVISHRGGAGGGTATVTQEGLDLVKQFYDLQQKYRTFLKTHVVANAHLKASAEPQ